MDKLNLTEKPVLDDSIEEYELHNYKPDSIDYNDTGEIRFVIQNQDIFFDIANSYLVFEGQLVKEDGSEYENDDQITFVNNGLMHMFRNISYSLSGQQIENINNPGEATTMLGLLKYSTGFERSKGINQLWYRENPKIEGAVDGFYMRHLYVIEKPLKKGSFRFCVPLKHIFGFCDSYNKVLYGFTHLLTLMRKPDDNALYKMRNADGTFPDNGKIVLTKITWRVPHVLPSIEHKVKLLKLVENKTELVVAYKQIQCDSYSVPQATTFDWRLSVTALSRKPSFLIIGFQTNKENDQKFNKGNFDHCKVKNISAALNSRKYPKIDDVIDFNNMRFAEAFNSALEFKEKYYNIDPELSSVNMTAFDYKDHYPLFVFDVSNQSDRIKNAVTDVYIKAEFEENVPANTKVYAVMVSDKIINLKADGSKMEVIQ